MNESYENKEEIVSEEPSSFEKDYVIIGRDGNTGTIFETIDRIKRKMIRIKSIIVFLLDLLY